MTNIPDLPPEFGTIVNDIEPNAEVQEIEQKIDLLSQERINLSVTREVYGKLEQQATFYGRTIEEHCLQVLGDHLQVLIGKPHIGGPSILSGNKTAKIKGPSFATNTDYMT